MEEKIQSLEKRIEKIEKYIKQRNKTKESEKENFIEWDTKRKESFLKTPQELYSSQDLVYYFRQESKRAGRPVPIFTWGLFKKAEKLCSALLDKYPANRCCRYIDYVIHGQTDIEKPSIFLLVSGWSQKWFGELDEWLDDQQAIGTKNERR